jgi:hypothetical protein
MSRSSWATLIGLGGMSACSLVESSSSQDAGALDAAISTTFALSTNESERERTASSATTEASATHTGEQPVSSEGRRDTTGATVPTDTSSVGRETSASEVPPDGNTSHGESSFPFGSNGRTDTGSLATDGDTSYATTVSQGSGTDAVTSVPRSSETATDVETEPSIPPGSECFDPADAGGCTCYVVANAEEDRFAFCFVALTRAAAKAECEAVGGGAHLVTIFDQTRNAWLSDAARTVGGVYRWWIGLTDEAVEGAFVWDDGTAYDADNASWNGNEPNNLGEEDCVEFTNGGWNDYGCDEEAGYICEL